MPQVSPMSWTLMMIIMIIVTKMMSKSKEKMMTKKHSVKFLTMKWLW